MKVLPRHVDRTSNDLQTAMSALENAISMLGSVTSTTHADADDSQLAWKSRARGRGTTVNSEHRWRFRPPKTGGTTSSDLSNTLSLLDSTIVAIDSAMSPPSSTFDVTSAHYRHQVRAADTTTDFRRSDVISLTSGMRPTEVHPRRFDSGMTSVGGSSLWWGQAWTNRTQLDTLPRIDSVELDVQRTGTAATSLSVLF